LAGVTGRPAAGGGRWIDVVPERLERWLDGFASRHGALTWEIEPEVVTVRAADGAVAECHVPFPPLTVDPASAYGGLLAHTRASRRVGVVLVRRGGHAVGVFDGSRLGASKVGSRYVQGRTAAGGTSQHRFARRREGQLRDARGAATDVAARVLLPHVARMDSVVTGGDRRMLTDVLADARLAPLRALAVERVLDVPDPRLAVLQETPAAFRAIRVRLLEP
jgi:hypothetical protein